MSMFFIQIIKAISHVDMLIIIPTQSKNDGINSIYIGLLVSLVTTETSPLFPLDNFNFLFAWKACKFK